MNIRLRTKYRALVENCNYHHSDQYVINTMGAIRDRYIKIFKTQRKKNVHTIGEYDDNWYYSEDYGYSSILRRYKKA